MPSMRRLRMGILENIGDQVAKNADTINEAIERGGDFIDSKTGDKFKEQIDQGQEALHKAVDSLPGTGGDESN